MNVKFPLDHGYLRRQCPNCNREFKWHDGPVEGAPPVELDVEAYSCPLCGEVGAKTAFWTHEQVARIRSAATSYGQRMVQDMLADAFRGSKNATYKPGTVPGGPAILIEPEDMMEVQSPCHPWEPVKVPTGWNAPLHCLICGLPYRI